MHALPPESAGSPGHLRSSRHSGRAPASARPLPADITVVNTAEELQRAIAASARDIEIRSHLDLRAPVVGGDAAATLASRSHDEPDLMHDVQTPDASFATVTGATRSVRVRSNSESLL